MIHRVNRAALLLLGAVLVAAGGYTLLLGTGVLDRVGVPVLAQPGQLYDRVVGVAVDPWVWQAGLVAAGVVSALLGLRLALAQVRRRRPARRRELTVTEAPQGRTTVRASAICRTLADDLSSIHGVDQASVSCPRIQHDTTVEAALTLARGIEPSQIDGEVEAAYRRAAAALTSDDLTIRSRIVFSDADPPRVR